MAYLLEETLKFPKDSFKSMKYQPYELKPSFSMYRVYEWHRHWYGNVYVSFSGGLDSTVLAYIVCLAYRKYKLDGTIPLVFSDTGTEFPEIRKFVHVYTEWLQKQFPDLDIRLEVIRPKHSFKWVMENKGFPITSKDTAGKIRKLRHGQLGERYRNYNDSAQKTPAVRKNVRGMNAPITNNATIILTGFSSGIVGNSTSLVSK